MSTEQDSATGRTIDFYFDFISPFSYLAWQRLPELARRYGYAVSPHVADLATLKTLAGNTAPRMVQMPLKLDYSRIDQQRWAERYGVPIVPPGGSHDSSWLNRGSFYVADRDQSAAYITAVWTRMRRDGRDLAEEGTWREVARDLGWDENEFVGFVRSEPSLRRYREASQAAHDRGVFGVPSMLIGNDMWWGNDRLDFLEEHLQAVHGRRQPRNSISR